MSDDKHKTRVKLLNELESIKDLLDEEDGSLDLEPPLLTSTIDDLDDAPLLTEAIEEPLLVDEVLSDEVLVDETPVAEALPDDIPVLQEAIDPVEAAIEPVQEDAVDHPADISELEQPSLFHASEGNTAERSTPEAGQTQPATAPNPPSAQKLSAARGENPFLPKHIRDRLTANRKNQAALMESLKPIAAPTPPPQPANISLPDEKQLIDELVQRFLPEIEAALRERLEAMIREQSKTPEAGSEDQTPELD